MSDQEGDLLTGAVDETSSGTSEDAGNQAPAEPKANDEGTLVTDNPETKNVPGWHDELPKELKGHESLVKFADRNGVAKAFIELERKQGRSIEIPGEDATEEDVSRFNTRMRGGIETPDGYDFSGIELPKVLENPDGEIRTIKELAYNMNLDQGNARKLVETYAERISAGVKAVRNTIKKSRQEGELELRKEWGGEFDKNIMQARRAIGDDKSLANLLKNTGLGNHPALVRRLAYLGSLVSEGNAPMGGPGGDTKEPIAFPMARQAAEARRKGVASKR